MFVFIFVSLLGKLREYRTVVFVACDRLYTTHPQNLYIFEYKVDLTSRGWEWNVCETRFNYFDLAPKALWSYQTQYHYYMANIDFHSFLFLPLSVVSLSLNKGKWASMGP